MAALVWIDVAGGATSALLAGKASVLHHAADSRGCHHVRPSYTMLRILGDVTHSIEESSEESSRRVEPIRGMTHCMFRLR